jgi:hypothetical protein
MEKLESQNIYEKSLAADKKERKDIVYWVKCLILIDTPFPKRSNLGGVRLKDYNQEELKSILAEVVTDPEYFHFEIINNNTLYINLANPLIIKAKVINSIANKLNLMMQRGDSMEDVLLPFNHSSKITPDDVKMLKNQTLGLNPKYNRTHNIAIQYKESQQFFNFFLIED